MRFTGSPLPAGVDGPCVSHSVLLMCSQVEGPRCKVVMVTLVIGRIIEARMNLLNHMGRGVTSSKEQRNSPKQSAGNWNSNNSRTKQGKALSRIVKGNR